MKKILLFSTLVFLASTVFSQKLKTNLDTVAYLLGANTAKNMMQELKEIEIPENMFMTGFTNYKDCKFTDEQINAILQEFFMQKEKAKQDKAKDLCTEKELQNQEFFMKNKEEKGVVTLENGLQYKVVKEGTGTVKPKSSDVVVLHYKGMLLDGTVFDSSIDRGVPATFPVNAVIPGFSQVLELMTVGSTYIAYIPSELGYGVRGAGAAIEPCSALIFEIQLLEIQNDTEEVESIDTTEKTDNKADKKAKKSKK
ncbi:MAG: FKBP-type peptidyl-prolyl cis-trans isomerase [Bacteroidales bacterium]|nr:FKBP-type peptidyl-prolyl cis-trans isomerase [Bacteroidales bacterium]